MYVAALVNAVAACLTITTLLYFKKTDRYKPAAYISIAILILSLASFFAVAQNQHYGLYWLCIMPPITYFLLDRNEARIITGLFGVYILVFILASSASWSPSEFDAQSIFNIVGATSCVLAMMTYYEKSRSEAWLELNETILQLTDSKDDLRLILDSAAEAIYGIDSNGKCTFCNRSCIDILGYTDQSELLGKNMHWQIHHSKRDGKPFPIDECRIILALRQGEGSHVDDEVFWRADGSPFDVEYFSYPQIKNGKLTGTVVTFMDIS
ncbi:MAG: PAS domain-containing protein, partial [Clostridiaceae bacterium]|nr:PAS domain-containing protein [Clostridiaceae bacterium]